MKKKKDKLKFKQSKVQSKIIKSNVNVNEVIVGSDEIENNSDSNENDDGQPSPPSPNEQLETEIIDIEDDKIAENLPQQQLPEDKHNINGNDTDLETKMTMFKNRLSTMGKDTLKKASKQMTKMLVHSTKKSQIFKQSQREASSTMTIAKPNAYKLNEDYIIAKKSSLSNRKLLLMEKTAVDTDMKSKLKINRKPKSTAKNISMRSDTMITDTKLSPVKAKKSMVANNNTSKIFRPPFSLLQINDDIKATKSNIRNHQSFLDWFLPSLTQRMPSRRNIPIMNEHRFQQTQLFDENVERPKRQKRMKIKKKKLKSEINDYQSLMSKKSSLSLSSSIASSVISRTARNIQSKTRHSKTSRSPRSPLINEKSNLKCKLHYGRSGFELGVVATKKPKSRRPKTKSRRRKQKLSSLSSSATSMTAIPRNISESYE